MQIRKRNSGIAFVELALMVPIIMLIMVVTIDFARLFYAAVKVADASRAGAQYGSQSNMYTADFDGMDVTAVDNAADLSGFTISTTERYCKCEDGSDTPCLAPTCVEGAPQIYVGVRGGYTFETLLKYHGIPGTIELSQRTVMRVQ